MDNRLVLSLWFALGIIAQVLIFHFRVYSKERALKLALAALGSMFFASLGFVDKMPVFSLVLIFCFLFCAIACFYFRLEFSQTIDELTFVFINGFTGFLLVYYLFQFKIWSVAAWLLAAVFLINQALIIVQKNPSTRRRAYYYVAYLCLTLILTVVQINKAIILSLLGDVQLQFRPLEVFISGTIWVNMWMSVNLLLPLLPFTTKDKSELQKIQEIKQHAKSLAERFSLTTYPVVLKLLITVSLAVLLWLLLSNNLVGIQIVLMVVLTISSFLVLKSSDPTIQN